MPSTEKGNPMNKLIRERSQTIRALYFEAERLAEKHCWGNPLSQSVEIASKQERQHRAAGRRVFNQSMAGRATVETCAMLFALRGFIKPKRARSFDNRADFLAAYSAAVRVESATPESKKQYQAFCRRARKAIKDIDYTELLPPKERP